MSPQCVSGLPPLLAGRSGTRWQMNCELTRVTDLRQSLKLALSPGTSVYNAVMRYMNLLLT